MLRPDTAVYTLALRAAVLLASGMLLVMVSDCSSNQAAVASTPTAIKAALAPPTQPPAATAYYQNWEAGQQAEQKLFFETHNPSNGHANMPVTAPKTSPSTQP